MDAAIRDEFALSPDDYASLLCALRARFGVEHIHELAFLSAEQVQSVSDRYEAAAVARLVAIATTHIGVEKLHRAAPDAHPAPDTHPRLTDAHHSDRSPDLASSVDHLLCQYIPGAPTARL
jgi:hypothetical protein